MTLPTFIGLGVQKGGTSWLHNQLLNHPEVYVPETRKEVHFFDWYFERGKSWYQKWFPENSDSYKAIGEITPEYIYFEDVLPRLKQTLPDAKFIVVLRHPVKRAFSHYQMIFQSGEGFKYKDFNEFMEKHPHGFKRGLYAEQLERWFKEFDPKNFLVLFSEELSGNDTQLNATFTQIGAFLDIDPALFDQEKAKIRIGKARSIPRFPRLMRFAQAMRQKLRDWDMDHIAIKLKKMGLTRQLFSSSKELPSLQDGDKQKWMEAYKEDIEKLEKLLNCPIPNWD